MMNIGNINTSLTGEVSIFIIGKLSEIMKYETLEYNGFDFATVEHNLFNKLKQSFPTGLCSKAIEVFEENNIKYDVIDNRVEPQKRPSLKLHVVKPYNFQKLIIDNAIERERFIIQVATGGGKTIIAAAILAKLNLKSIFIVHTGDLFEQSYDELSKLLKIPIGRIGGGLCDIKQINVCMIQTIHAALDKKYIPFDDDEKELMEHDEIVRKSFVKYNDLRKFIEEVECVLIDECHHLRATGYVNVMKACKRAFFRGGLSATPQSGDGRDMILQAYAGSIIGKVTASYLIDHGYLVPPTIYFLPGLPSTKYLYKRQRYRTLYNKYIVKNGYRNNLIKDCVSRLKELKKSVLITVTTINHGKILLKLIKETGISVEFIYSHVDKMVRKKYIDQIRDKKLDVIIGTTLADEGLNIPALDSLILAGGGKSPTRMIQRIGRVLRLSPGKKDAIVIDFRDSVRYLLGHYKKRREICEGERRFKIVESFN